MRSLSEDQPSGLHSCSGHDGQLLQKKDWLSWEGPKADPHTASRWKVISPIHRVPGRLRQMAHGVEVGQLWFGSLIMHRWKRQAFLDLHRVWALLRIPTSLGGTVLFWHAYCLLCCVDCSCKSEKLRHTWESPKGYLECGPVSWGPSMQAISLFHHLWLMASSWLLSLLDGVLSPASEPSLRSEQLRSPKRRNDM